MRLQTLKLKNGGLFSLGKTILHFGLACPMPPLLLLTNSHHGAD